MRRKILRTPVVSLEETWKNLPDDVKGYIEKYLNDPIIPEATTEEMVDFAKSGVGLKIISLIIQYGKMCAKNERKHSADQSRDQIDQIRSILKGCAYK